MNIRRRKKKSLEERIHWIEGSVGILANAEQYNRARFEVSRQEARLCYNYLSGTQEFRDWYLVEHTIKQL